MCISQEARYVPGSIILELAQQVSATKLGFVTDKHVLKTKVQYRQYSQHTIQQEIVAKICRIHTNM